MSLNPWNKKNYFDRGYKHGKSGTPRDIYDPETWQWFHYTRGYNAGRAELNFTQEYKEPPRAPAPNTKARR